jgi:Zn-dependent protease with chaperone function
MAASFVSLPRMTPGDPIALARSALPGWVSWLPVLLVPTSFVAGALPALCAAVVGLRGVPASPWSERARATYPLRLWLSVLGLVMGAAAGAVGRFVSSPVGAWPPWAIVVGSCVAAMLAVDLVRLGVERRVHRVAIPWLDWVRAKAVLLPLRMPHLVVAGAGVLLVPEVLDRRGAVLAVGFVLALLISASGIVAVIERALGVLHPAPERLRAIVARASERTNIRARDVMVIPTFGIPFCNAFALPLVGRLAFTEDMLRTLGDDELEAIAAHELGHVSEPFGIAFARTLGSLVLAPIVLLRPMWHAFGPEVCIVLLLATFVLVRLVLVRLSRRMEERADRVAKGESHDDHGVIYAQALSHTYERNLIPQVMRSKATAHPDLYDRLVAAGAKPSHPRPLPPKMPVGTRLATVLGLVVVCALYGVAAGHFREVHGLRAAHVLGEVAHTKAMAGDRETALALYAIASEVDEHNPWYPANRAIVLAGVDRCDEALWEAARAQHLKRHDPRATTVVDIAHSASVDCARRFGDVPEE